jgi:alkanesulfonate monooxygenase SsuD/methylene tetrahydromethanopterin reductase-like flavin-dependent oxidoreductase (luciferase family)
MSTPLQRPFAEVVSLCERFEAAVSQAPPQTPRPEHLLLRRACVYESANQWQTPVAAAIDFGRYFENLFRNLGAVKNGFPEPVDFEVVAEKADYAEDALRENMMFGTPDEVAAKLEKYRAAGVAHFLYGACFGLPHKAAVTSLKLFVREVMPRFAGDD